MNIHHDDRGRDGIFYHGEGDERAEMTYAHAGIQDALVFDHTYVPETLRGRGIAEALVDEGVAYARSRNLKVVPACSYVRSLFKAHPEKYGDIATEEEKPVGRV